MPRRSPVSKTPEPLDDRLRDDDALDEIDLTSKLMIAASAKGHTLTQAEVDDILGLKTATDADV